MHNEFLKYISPESVEALKAIQTGNYDKSKLPCACIRQLSSAGLIASTINLDAIPEDMERFDSSLVDYTITEYGKGFLFALQRNEGYLNAVTSIADTAKETAEDARADARFSKITSVIAIIISIISIISQALK